MLVEYELWRDCMWRIFWILFLPKPARYNNIIHFLFLIKEYNVDKLRLWGLGNFK